MNRLLLAVLLCGCVPPVDDLDANEAVPILPARWPSLDGPCSMGPDDPDGLLVTTTDFSTGAVSVIDVGSRTVTADVALGTPDGIPFFGSGRGLVVHRFQYDFVDVLDPARGFKSAGEHAAVLEGVSAPNPRAVALGPDGLAYVPLFGAPQILVMDLGLPPGSSVVDAIDVRAFADADGTPEASLAVACGSTLFASIDRIATDKGFARAGGDALVAIDLVERTALDLDPDRAGAQGIQTQGAWIKQLRVDPADAHAVFALTEGIERVDLRDGTTTWAVTPEAFAAAGIVHFQLPIAFDVAGENAYVAAYAPETGEAPDCTDDPTPCFRQVRLFRAPLSGGPLVAFADGFDAVERTLEVLDNELWFGSRRRGEPGVWVYDLAVDPPAVAEGPLLTGLPPYAMTTVVLP